MMPVQFQELHVLKILVAHQCAAAQQLKIDDLWSLNEIGKNSDKFKASKVERLMQIRKNNMKNLTFLIAKTA